MNDLADDLLAFWFDPEHEPRDVWFRKDPAFDAVIRTRYQPAVEEALAGGYDAWRQEARGTLALLLLIDQFTRNIYRDTPRAFAGDARALAVAEAAIASGQDRLLRPYERTFVYLPFEHAENLAAQERGVGHVARLESETGLRGLLEWSEKHATVIRRFGRFPHRNSILGRASTPEELEFLTQPGSRF